MINKFEGCIYRTTKCAACRKKFTEQIAALEIKNRIFEKILAERNNQKVWNDYHITDFQKLITLVTEELGESVKEYFHKQAIQGGSFAALEHELIQVCALIFSYLENKQEASQ